VIEGEVFCGQECKNKFDVFKGRWKDKKPRRGLVGKLMRLAIVAAICLIAVKIGVQRNIRIFVRINQAIFGK